MTVTNTSLPVVSGTASVGHTLSSTSGTWTYDDPAIFYAYQWERCDSGGGSCSDIAGEVASVYTVKSADVGHTLRCKVTATEGAAPTGDKFAATWGSDSNPGTLAQPYRTPAKLSASLTPGQIGMLRGGTYGQFSGYDSSMSIEGNGAAGNPITITNYPGEHVLLRGAMSFAGSYVTIRNLHFDTTNDQRPDHGCGVSAFPYECDAVTDVIFEYNEIFQSGNSSYASNLKNSGIYQAQGTNVTYRYNLIHDIGGCQFFDHGIYLGHGDGTQIYGNWIWNDVHGWGMQLYPAPTNASIHSNVIDACGAGFVIGDDGTPTTYGNDVYNNVILNSVQTVHGSSGYALSGLGPVDTTNKFRDNCCYGNPNGVRAPSPQTDNIQVSGNITSNPNLADVAAHDYRPTGSTPATVLGYGLPTFVPGPTV